MTFKLRSWRISMSCFRTPPANVGGGRHKSANRRRQDSSCRELGGQRGCFFNRNNRLVLWIAQTDELCEQALMFREIWANLEVPDESLRIVRFWEYRQTPCPEDDEPTVIVASIQTLNSRLNECSALAWAANPALLVIDECHQRLTPSYTGILRWFHPDAKISEREPTIVGLSATPFRDETTMNCSTIGQPI